MSQLLTALTLLLCYSSIFGATTTAKTACDFRFMSRYAVSDVFGNESVRTAFLTDMMTWEGRFAVDGVGLNVHSAMTYDGSWLHYDTGLPFKLHDFSAASKESVHLGLLALALDPQNANVQTFFQSSLPSDWSDSVGNFVLDQLKRKIATYENWNTRHPGFGGFLPWYHVNDSGIFLLDNWKASVPSLDNGEMIWGLVAVVQALTDAGQTELATRYQNYLDLLAANGLRVFLNPDPKRPGLACVTGISDIDRPPTANTYNTSTGCLLDDPYEGELFLFFVELFSDWSAFGGDAMKQAIWDLKRTKMVPVNYTDGTDTITVQRGYWFSSHEQWKFMELPYFDVDIANRLYLNGERARAHFSWSQKFPGLFAAVTNVTSEANANLQTYPNYVSGCGIQQIASQKVQTNSLFTPYGAYPMLLHPQTRNAGLAWYANMLAGDRMQGPHGSTESIWANGALISPVTTWDSKITSVLAVNGGILSLTRKYLQRKQKLDAFKKRVQSEWEKEFGTNGELPGEKVELKLPRATFPKSGKEFNCTQSGDHDGGSGAAHVTVTPFWTTAITAIIALALSRVYA